VSNIEINSGDSVNISGVSTVATTTTVSQPEINVSVAGVISTKDSHYTHNQNSVSDTWSVTHNLGKKPSVTVVDSADTVLYGAVLYTNNNSLTITLSAPTSGKAYMN
jgi:hypothetical protein